MTHYRGVFPGRAFSICCSRFMTGWEGSGIIFHPAEMRCFMPQGFPEQALGRNPVRDAVTDPDARLVLRNPMKAWRMEAWRWVIFEPV